MKKYIVPTITVEKIELANMIAASPTFAGEGLPTTGSSSEKGSTADALHPGHEAEGYSKSFNVWE